MSEKPISLQHPYTNEEARDNLARFIRAQDRATPPVFVGREDVLNEITQAVEDCRTTTDPIECFTRVVYGPPGAGKSTLLQEIRQRLGSEYGSSGALTIVSLQGDELARPGFVTSAFIKELSGSYPDVLGSKTISSNVKAGTSGTGLELLSTESEIMIDQQIEAGSSVWRAIRENTSIPENHVFLLLVDESQNIEGVGQDRIGKNYIVSNLNAGFRTTNNLKIVPVFAGLSNTREVLGDRGVSRIPEDGSTYLGALTQGETEALVSGWMRYEAFAFDNLFTDKDTRRVSKMIAFASEGWPRHANTYLRELARSVLEAGVTNEWEVDLNDVFSRGHESRSRYYRVRLDSAGLDTFEDVISIAARKTTKRRIEKNDLRSIAQDISQTAYTLFDTHLKDAIRSGVLEYTPTNKTQLQFPIQSFHTYMKCGRDDLEFQKAMQDQMQSHTHTLMV